MRKSKEELQPSISGLSPSIYESLQNDLISKMHSRDVTFFEGFGNAMHSGDPVQVSTALYLATQLYNSVFFTDEKYFNLSNCQDKYKLLIIYIVKVQRYLRILA